MKFSHTVRASMLAVCIVAISISAAADKLYSDGSPVGQQGFAINGTFRVQDSFTLSSASTLSGVTFGNLLFNASLFGSAVQATSVDWEIVKTEGSTTLACAGCSGTATLTQLADYGLSKGDSALDLTNQSFSLPNLTLGAGTYWLQLSNEVVSAPVYAYWDEDSGPSGAWQSNYGGVTGQDVSGSNCSDQGAGDCSNSFTIDGTAAPEPAPLGLFTLAGSALCLLGRKKFWSRS